MAQVSAEAHGLPALGDLLQRLRAGGLAIGVEEEASISLLLVARAEAGLVPRTGPELADLLTPILARTPDEQRSLHRLIAATAPGDLPSPLKLPSSDQPSSAAETDRLARTRYLAATAVLGMLCVGLVLASPYLTPGAEVDKIDPPPTKPMHGSPEAWPPGLVGLEIGRRQPSDVVITRLIPRPDDQQTALRLGLTAFALLLTGLALAWLWLRWRDWSRMSARLERGLVDRLRPSAPVEFLYPPSFDQLLIRLDQPRLRPSRRLDRAATVRAVARDPRRPLPQYQPQRLPNDYLLFIDEMAFTDHQAELFLRLAARLRANGLRMETFVFSNAPLVSWPHGEPGRSRALADILTENADARVIIASNAHPLVDPGQLTPFSWSEQFDAHPFRVVLTPEDDRRWPLGEDVLLRAGWFVLPATEAGLGQLPAIAVLTDEASGNGRLAARMRAASAPPLPPLIALHRERWRSPVPPEADVREQLLTELYFYLGHSGFQWLAACAVFPRLWWHLTLRLAQVVAEHDQRDDVGGDGRTLARWPTHDAVLDLARLPWFRHGFMPDWLRQALIEHLDEDAEFADRVRESVAAMIVHAAEAGEDSRDRALTPSAQSLTEARSILAHLGADDQNAFRATRIFLERRRAELRTVPYDASVVDRFRADTRWRGSGPAPLIALGGLVAGIAWWFFLATPPTIEVQATLAELLAAHKLHVESKGSAGARLELDPSTRLDDVNLTGVVLDGAKLAGITIAKSSLAGAKLGDADLTGTVIELSNLSGAVLSRARMARVNVRQTTLNGARFLAADLTGAEFDFVDLRDVIFGPNPARDGDAADDPNRKWEVDATFSGTRISDTRLGSSFLSPPQRAELCLANPGWPAAGDNRPPGLIEQIAAACRTPPPPPPPPRPCRHSSHGIERYNFDQQVSRDSDWRSGGSNPQEWCAALRGQLEKQYAGARLTIGPASERTRDNCKPFRCIQYNYTCTIQVQSDPIYFERISSACRTGATAQ